MPHLPSPSPFRDTHYPPVFRAGDKKTAKKSIVQINQGVAVAPRRRAADLSPRPISRT
jgi:hypothetical protein